MSMSIPRPAWLILCLALLLPAMAPPGAQAHEYQAGAIEIDHPWSRATPPTARIGAGFMTLTNRGDSADRLVAVTSAVADRVEIHQTTIGADGMASMQPLDDGLPLPAGATVTLKPGSFHLMFVGLKHPLQDGASFDATLEFEQSGAVDVRFVIGAMGAGVPHEHH